MLKVEMSVANMLAIVAVNPRTQAGFSYLEISHLKPKVYDTMIKYSSTTGKPHI